MSAPFAFGNALNLGPAYMIGLMACLMPLCLTCEVMEIREVENTVKLLCAQASATRRDQREFKSVLIRLREFLREHIDVIRSMSDETFAELRKIWHLNY